MSTRVVDRVDDWDQRQFSGGHGGLADLAGEEFSGVVRAGGAELYMTAGTVVAIRRGSMADFEDASGTAFVAPDPSMPLLAAMQAEDVDPRAEYYSEETPISEVDRTLSDGGFTGYVELSENVLSGDYFVVYHGGTSSSVAFVGASEQLVTGDEAFETADDEVGIYHVHQVDVEPIEIPASAGSTAAAAESEDATAEEGAADDSGEATGDAPAGAEDADDEDAGDEDGTGEAGSGAGDEATPSDDTADSGTPEEPAPEPTEAGAETETAADAGSAGETGTPSGAAAEAATTTAEEGGEAGSAGTTDRAGGERGAGGESGGATGQARQGSGSGDAAPARDRGSGAQSPRGGAVGSGGQAGDLETRGVPSLDPDLTVYPERSTGGRSGASSGAPAEHREQPAGGRQRQPAGGGASRGAGGQRPADRQGADAATDPGGGAAEGQPAGSGGRATEAGSAELGEIEAELADREAELEELEADLETAEAEREETESELEQVREERDELEAEAERLREELERLEDELGAATDAERRMTPTEAIEGTNLFVDYESKGQGTLEKAHGGSETRDDVRANLQLGVHTEFDDGSVAVGGQDFGEFLRGTIQYRFAEWLLGRLLFEIRDTGQAEALTDLYDTIPEIRRVEFNGEIDVEYVEDGQEKVATERFDVIFRHRMGDPLVVANLNDARDPATGGMMTSLVTAAERVGQAEDSLAAAFLVTSSFFESEALETVAEATKGGILSRDKRTSFVNLSRKSGYHLCLVAAREGNFHMEVPEL